MRRKEIKQCSVPLCERVHTARGFCSSHYEQFKRGKTPVEGFKPLPARDKCVISSCDRPSYCKGGCRSHYDIAQRFNVSLSQINSMYDYDCQICGSSESKHIDHDHTCCEGDRSCGDCIRGVLCESCNMAVGALGDSAELVQRAVDYLRRFSAP